MANRSLNAAALLLAALALLEIGLLHLGLGFENRLSDAFVRAQAALLKPDADIVIVDIDEASLARMQEEAGSWPWPRAVHADLLAGLEAQQPAAIVFDLLFAEADRFRPESDQAFVDSLQGVANVYFPMLRLDAADDARGVPLREFAPALGALKRAGARDDARAMLLLPTVLPPALWRTGVVNFLEDDDGVGRRYPLRMNLQGWELPSLPARVARDLGWPLPPGEELRLHWRGRPGASFEHVSYADLHEDFLRRERKRPADEFRGRIVVIGTAASGLRDLRVTPMGSLYPGVEILATALDNLKNQRQMQRVPLAATVVLSWVLIALLWLAFRLRGHARGVGLGLWLVSAGLI